jgi:hypothetical protein
VLPFFDVDVPQRAAALEVDVNVSAGFDVAGARDGGLHEALLRGDHLAGGSCRASRRADVRDCHDGQADTDQRQQIQMPRQRPTGFHHVVTDRPDPLETRRGDLRRRTAARRRANSSAS